MNNMNNRTLVRKSSFKKTVHVNDGHRRLHETRVQVRKKSREEYLRKRRSQPEPSVMGRPVVIRTADLPRFMQVLTNPSSSPAAQLDAVRSVRRMVCVNEPPTTAIVNAGFLPQLVRCLGPRSPPELQYEAVWALGNIAATHFARRVAAQDGCVPALVQLLHSPFHQVRGQAVWCLGNIAGESVELRDHVLACGIVEPIIENLQKPASKDHLTNFLWCAACLERGSPQPPLEIVRELAEALSFYLEFRHGHKKLHSDYALGDEGVVDILWGLSYISDSDIQTVVDVQVVPHLVRIVADSDSAAGTNSAAVLTPVSLCLGNIVSGNEDQTNAVIEAGFMKHVKKLLQHPKRAIQKTACWALSNIMAGTHAQIAKIFSVKEVLIDVMEKAINPPFVVQNEAIWVVANIMTCGSDEQVDLLMTCRGIESMCVALGIRNDRTVLAALAAIRNALEVGVKLGKKDDYIRLLEECDGIPMLESLQEHASDEIYEKSIAIIEDYIGVEEEEDENIAPKIHGETFAFDMGDTTSKKLFASPTNSFSFGGNNDFSSPFK